MPLTAFSEVTPIVAAQVWLAADGTNVKVILAAQPTTWRLDTLVAVNDDNAAHVFSLTLVDPASALHGIGSVSIPALAGHAPNPSYDVFNALFPSTQVGIAVPPGWILQGFLSVGATNAVGMVGYGGYF